MRLHRVQPPTPPPDIPSTSVTDVITHWLDNCVRCLHALTNTSDSPPPAGFLSSSAFSSSVSLTELLEYAFQEIWISLLFIIMLAYLLRQLFIAYRLERTWQALQSLVRATVAGDSVDSVFLKDEILNFFSSSDCSHRVSMRYTAELFTILERRADKYPPQELRALASEIAALGAAVDLAALHIVIKSLKAARAIVCAQFMRTQKAHVCADVHRESRLTRPGREADDRLPAAIEVLKTNLSAGRIISTTKF